VYDDFSPSLINFFAMVDIDVVAAADDNSFVHDDE
jgi:hypothetical protein